MARGGARPGAGRRTLAQHLKTADLAQKALISRYGSLEKALVALLNMNEAVLTRFVFEHAMGKPTDNIEVDGEIVQELTFKVIRAKD